VKAGDNSRALAGFIDKHWSVRETPQQGAPDVFVNEEKLELVGGYPLDSGFNGGAEVFTQPRRFASCQSSASRNS